MRLVNRDRTLITSPALEKRVTIDNIKGLLISGVYLSVNNWIFSACRLKKHAYAELLPSEKHASQGKNVRTNTRNSAFPRALSLTSFDFCISSIAACSEIVAITVRCIFNFHI